MDSFEEFMKWLVGIGAAMLAGAVSLVRNGDIVRIEAIEARQKAFEEGNAAARAQVFDEIRTLRTHVDDNHSQLVSMLMNKGP